MKINNDKCVHYDVENKFFNIIWGGKSSFFTFLHLPNSSPLQRGIKLGARHKCFTVQHHLVKSSNRVQSQVG